MVVIWDHSANVCADIPDRHPEYTRQAAKLHTIVGGLAADIKSGSRVCGLGLDGAAEGATGDVEVQL